VGGGSQGGSVGGGTGVQPSEPAASAEPAEKFFDDTEGHWAESYIDALALDGYVKGDNHMFYPENPVTRAEFLAMAARAADIAEGEYAGQFADVGKEDWYGGVIQAGLDAGLISADEAFHPNDVVTREEMCKMLMGAAALIVDLSDEAREYALDYTDAAAIGQWAVDFVKAASYYELMEGNDGVFDPSGTATRAQAAAVISRLLTLAAQE
jgi:hypothetical protein